MIMTAPAAVPSILPLPPKLVGVALLNETIGVLQIGSNVACLAFGITILQMYLYFERYCMDDNWQKASVIILGVLDLCQLVFTLHFTYYRTTLQWGNPAAFVTDPWSFNIQFCFTIAIICTVQTLYVLRFWKFSEEKRILPSILSVVTVAGYGVGIMLGLKIYSLPNFTQVFKIAWITYFGLGYAAANDLLIAFAFFFLLRKRRDEITTTRSVVSRLMIYIVSTGFLTSALSIVEIVLFVLSKSMNVVSVFLALEFMISKLYVNSYLAMLNAREGLRREHKTHSFLSVDSTLKADRSAHGHGQFDKDEYRAAYGVQVGQISHLGVRVSQWQVGHSYPPVPSPNAFEPPTSPNAESVNYSLPRRVQPTPQSPQSPTVVQPSQAVNITGVLRSRSTSEHSAHDHV